MTDLRSQFQLRSDIVFLNHGSYGATPKPVFESYQRWQRELESQPVEFLARRSPQLMAHARQSLGDYLGAGRDDLVFVSNATVGVNIVARSLHLGANDEVLTTYHEYGACDRTWRYLSARHGFKYRACEVDLSSRENFVESFFKNVTPQTRVIFLSHITSATATIFPVAEICARARAAGILTVVDGAHTAGQIPVHLATLGADFYTGNLHKWLCAPKGAGFLYARPASQSLLEPLIVSWGYESENPGPSQFVDHHEWQGTRDLSAFLAVPDAISFQRENNWDAARLACHALAVDAEREFRALTGLDSFYADASWFAQMFVARLPARVDLLIFKTRLYDEFRIEAPVINWRGEKFLRISLQGYNTHADIDALLKALPQLL